jgi:hypothetical protein
VFHKKSKKLNQKEEKAPIFLYKEIHDSIPSFTLNTDSLALVEMFLLNSPDYTEFKKLKYIHVYIGRTYLYDIEKRYFNIYYKLAFDQSYLNYMIEVIML